LFESRIQRSFRSIVGGTSGQRSPQIKNESQFILASKVKISKILTVLRLVRDEAHTV
jgi:hypothetical protein